MQIAFLKALHTNIIFTLKIEVTGTHTYMYILVFVKILKFD